MYPGPPPLSSKNYGVFVSLRSLLHVTFAYAALVSSNLPNTRAGATTLYHAWRHGGFVLGPAPVQTTSSQVAWYLLFSSCLSQIRFLSAGFTFIPFTGIFPCRPLFVSTASDQKLRRAFGNLGSIRTPSAASGSMPTSACFPDDSEAALRKELSPCDPCSFLLLPVSQFLLRPLCVARP